MSATAPSRARAADFARPVPGFSPLERAGRRVLLVCLYDPQGIPTIIETIAHLQSASRHSVTVLNLFEYREGAGPLQFPRTLDFDAFDVLVIHNTVSYDVDNLRSLDKYTPRRLHDWRGVKVLLKQDENHRFRELAAWIGDVGFDVLFTCLPPEAEPLVYPADVAGSPRTERMLTGYITPSLRSWAHVAGSRPVDIGYRGSRQPLSFGRLAFEKQTIGEDVAARLAGRGFRLDISSRWEDRIGGDAWLHFLSGCKATLGAESGASIFDLHGDLTARLEALQRKHASVQDDRQRAEAVLSGLADLEGNVGYQQISPRHFEAAACGTLQLLFPGEYSGILQTGRHYVPLARDFSNLEEAVSIVQDPGRRAAIVQAAREEVVANPTYWIENFVARVDDCIDDAFSRRPSAMRAREARSDAVQRAAAALRPSARARAVSALHRLWRFLPASLQDRMRPLARRLSARR